MAAYFDKSLVVCPVDGETIEVTDDGAYVIGKGHSGRLTAECQKCGVRWALRYEKEEYRMSPWELFFTTADEVAVDPRCIAAGAAFRTEGIRTGGGWAFNPCWKKKILNVTPESGTVGAFCRRMRKEWRCGGYRQAVATLKWFAGESYFFTENYKVLKGALDVLVVDPRSLTDEVWRAWGLSIAGHAS